MMKAVLLDGFGGPEVLALGEVERPLPGPDQVLIRVVATSVNRPDIVQRQGNYPAPKGDSEVLGLEVAGTIESLGPGVDGWREGDRVMALVGGGGYAEFAVAHAGHLIAIPSAMSFERAACVCETYLTAYLNLFRLGGLGDGDSVLLHGGGGGVNTAAIHLCRALVPNARIIVTASPAKLERVRALGADEVIDYRNQNFAEQVKLQTDKRGVQVILDHIGAPYLADNLKSLAVGGRLVVIGVMGGGKAEVNLALMMVKRQHIIGSVLRARPVQEKTDIIRDFSKTVIPHMADGGIVPLVDRVFELDQVADAHRYMEQSAHFGKIVLTL